LQLQYFSLIFLKVSLNYAIKLITNGAVEKCDVFLISKILLTAKLAGWFAVSYPRQFLKITHMLNEN